MDNKYIIVGKIGENKVKKKLLNNFSQKYRGVWVWNDVHLLAAQMYHILIIRDGICFTFYIIVTKNWSGDIIGKPYERYWIQKTEK